MSENPYQAPFAEDSPVPATLGVPVGGVTEQQVYIDGEFLVVTSGTSLPQLCVKTGMQTDAADQKTKTLTWAPGWIYVLILVNIIFLIIAYFITRKKCVLTFSESSESRGARIKRTLIAACISVALFLSIPLTIAVGSDAAIIASIVISIIGLLAVFVVGSSPLRIVRHRDGLFWVKGIAPEFLNAIRS